MSETYRIDLQYFAGEGAAPGGEGGGEGSTGESAAVAGQQDVLERLGVPRDKVEKYRARKGRTERAAAAPAEPAGDTASAEPEGQDAAAETEKPAERKTLKQLLQEDGDLNAEMQEIVRARLKEYDKAEGKSREALKTLDPALKVLQRFYGQEGELDAGKLAEAIGKDDRYFEQMATELGTDTDVARKLYERDRLIEAEKLRAEEERRQDELRRWIADLRQQETELKKIYPSFNLDAEMQNPRFRNMVHPSGGLTVQQAFQALHYQELRQAEAAAISSRVKEELARSIAAGQNRPVEGKRAQSASTGVVTPQYSRADREDLKRRIYAGEKIYPRG